VGEASGVFVIVGEGVRGGVPSSSSSEADCGPAVGTVEVSVVGVTRTVEGAVAASA
jgi:hypothetical protein